MSLRLTFEIQLYSDYHVSSGYGFGQSVDSSLLRDYDSAPLLRGTMIAGLLRDGFNRLISTPAIAQSKAFTEKRFTALEERLFGLEEHPKRWSYSSARPQGGSGGEPGRWASQDVTRVAINPLTRRADEHKLFTEEEGDARLRFTFTADCPTATPRDLADGYALVASAAMVRALGSARRRGRGECRIVLVKAEGFLGLGEQSDLARSALEAFRKAWLDPLKEQPELTSADSTKDMGAVLQDEKPLAFRVIAFLVEPLLAAKRSESVNTFETQTMIPGSVLLGALATRAAYSLGHEDQPAGRLFTELFIRGSVSASDLLPAWKDENGESIYPSVPAPFAHALCDRYPWRHPVVSLLYGSSALQCPSCQEKMEAKKGGFLYKDHQRRSYKEPDTTSEMHIRIDPDTGRVRTGDLYQYHCLSAGQYFIGELTCAGEISWQKLQETTGIHLGQIVEIRLGKGTRRGYGLVRLYLQLQEENAASPLFGLPVNQRVLELEQPLDLLLLSDTIIMDPWSRSCTGFETGWLAEQFGVDPQDIQIERQVVNHREVDAFNTYRRMPRWRDVALRAGSCARVHLLTGGIEKLVARYREQANKLADAAALPLAALRWKISQIEQQGVGLRRHEGFGRVAFNHPALLPGWSEAVIPPLSLEDLPDEMKPTSKINSLARERDFEEKTWSIQLDQEQQKGLYWQNLNGNGDAAARLIFLSLGLPIEEIQARLGEFNKPRAFYGRTIDRKGEDRKDKVDPKLVAYWIELVGRLAKYSPECQMIGLRMLAERLALVDNRNSKTREGAK